MISVPKGEDMVMEVNMDMDTDMDIDMDMVPTIEKLTERDRK